MTQSVTNAGGRLVSSSSEGKALVRRYLEELVPSGAIHLLDEVFSADLVAHLGEHSVRGIRVMRDYVTAFHAAFPDVRYSIEDEIAEDDRIAVRWRWEGTHRGQFQGIAPTGRRVSQTGTTVFRTSGGRIVEAWPQADFMGLMGQLGATVQLPGRTGSSFG